MKRIYFGIIIFSIVGLLTTTSASNSPKNSDEEKKKELLETICTLKSELSQSILQLPPDYMRSIYDILQKVRNKKVESLKLKKKSLSTIIHQQASCKDLEVKNNLGEEKRILTNEVNVLKNELREFDDTWIKPHFKNIYNRQKKLDDEVEKYENKYGPLPEINEDIEAPNNESSNSFAEDFNKAVARLKSVQMASQTSYDKIVRVGNAICQIVEAFSTYPKDNYFERAVLPVSKYVEIPSNIKDVYKNKYKKDLETFEDSDKLRKFKEMLSYSPNNGERIDSTKVENINSIANSLDSLNNNFLSDYRLNLEKQLGYLVFYSAFMNYDHNFMVKFILPAYEIIASNNFKGLSDIYQVIKLYPEDCKKVWQYLNNKFKNNIDWKKICVKKGAERVRGYKAALNDFKSQGSFVKYSKLNSMRETPLGGFLLKFSEALESKVSSSDNFNVNPYVDEIYKLYLGSLSPEERVKLQAKKEEAKPAEPDFNKRNDDPTQKVETDPASGVPSSETPGYSPEPNTNPSPEQKSTTDTSITTVPAPTSPPGQGSQKTVTNSETKFDQNGDPLSPPPPPPHKKK